MSLPDTKEVAAFLSAIRKAPFDDNTRAVFADWIQENVPDSEDLQAAYAGGAKKYIEDFCARALAYYHPDKWYKTKPDPDDEDYAWQLEQYRDDEAFFTYEYVVNMALVMTRTGDYAFPVGPVQEAGRILEDETERRALWDALEVITGYHFDKKFRKQAYTVCSC